MRFCLCAFYLYRSYALPSCPSGAILDGHSRTAIFLPRFQSFPFLLDSGAIFCRRNQGICPRLTDRLIRESIERYGRMGEPVQKQTQIIAVKFSKALNRVLNPLRPRVFSGVFSRVVDIRRLRRTASASGPSRNPRLIHTSAVDVEGIW